MMGTEDACRALRELGLSEYESRAYIVLLAMGELTPREVSDTARIPYTKVYEVLKRLEVKGWVKRVSVTPLVFAPRRPREVLSELRERMENTLRRAERALEELERTGLGLATPVSIYVLRKAAALERVVKRLIVSARKEALIFVATRGFLSLVAGLPKYPSNLRVLVREGVGRIGVGEQRQFKVILPMDLVIVDRERLVLGFSALLRKGEPRVCGVLIVDPEVAAAAAEYFDMLWAIASKGKNSK